MHFNLISDETLNDFAIYEGFQGDGGGVGVNLVERKFMSFNYFNDFMDF